MIALTGTLPDGSSCLIRHGRSSDGPPVRPDDEYDGIEFEYAGLPVNPAVFTIRVCHSLFRG